MRRRTGLLITCLSLLAALANTAGATAQGGPGGGGGGTPAPCAPLTDTVGLARSDATGNWAISVVATVRNCTSVGQAIKLKVEVPGSATSAFSYSTLLPPGASFTRIASPVGSTPLQLQFGRSYNVVATLRQTAPVTTTLATVTTPVTIPAAPKG
jgi:hypothetical protein